MTIDLDELERLEREATPGPWVDDADDRPGQIRDVLLAYAKQHRVATAWGSAYTATNATEDASLIAAARNALPALIRIARAAKACVTNIGPQEDAALTRLDQMQQHDDIVVQRFADDVEVVVRETSRLREALREEK